MSDELIEYSLNTHVFFNQNILNQKISELFKNNNMKGGDDFNNIGTSNFISTIIGIIIIIIGFILLWHKNDLVELEATILKKSYSNKKNNTEYKINISYNVNSTQYSKIITLNKNDILNDSTIKIYYKQSDPNSIQLVNPNYSVMGIGSIIIGSIVMIFSLFDYDSFDNYTNIDGYDIVYTT